MRIPSYAIAAFAIAMATAPFTFAQVDAAKLTITNYQLMSEQRLTGTQSYFTYRADLVNTGPSLPALTATLTPARPGSIQVANGKGSLHFISVLPNTQVSSANAFTILMDRTVPFSFNELQWSFNGPAANAGAPQTVAPGATVMLDASASTNLSGAGNLTYSWSLTTVPTGSAASLNNPSCLKPSFVADVAGSYVAAVTVSNGFGTDTASVTLSTTNSSPSASAGPDQTILRPGSTVYLDGSKSSDVDGNLLSYSWAFVQAPSGSSALLTGASTVSPTFIADQPGVYRAQLVVSDGAVTGAPDFVVVTVIGNTAPVANAGSPQITSAGAAVQLDGSKSTDVDGNSLTYKWSLISIPPGSKATPGNPALVNPVFTADVSGSYVAQLIVNDGTTDSLPATVTITTTTILPPVANAGTAQTVYSQATVALSGSGTDPQSRSLTYRWSLITLPAGSNAVLSNPATSHPTFVADQPGAFVAQLIVNDGTLDSAPSTVVITTTITAPIANPGAAQTITVGATARLDGADSSDPGNLPLNYKWSLLTAPAGSAAGIASPTSAMPSFLADLAGTYVAQLIVNNGFRDSAPATVTITSGQGDALVLTPNPLNLVNSAGLLTITAGTPAGPGGLVVNLTVTDKTTVTAPATVTIPQGQTSITASITPGVVGSTRISASAPGFHPDSATVNVNASALYLSLSRSSVGITKTVAGTVTLSGPAPAGGVTITLASEDTAKLTVSSTVFIREGATSPDSPAQIRGVSFGSAVVTASAAGFTGDRKTVMVASALNFSPAVLSVRTGTSQNVTLALAGPAPAGGLTVNLASDSRSAATVPATVAIPENVSSITVQVNGVAAGTANITASSTAGGIVSDMLTINVGAGVAIAPASLPPAIAGVAYSVPLAATGGAAPYVFSATGLPSGLSVSAAGQITGTPQSTGTSSVVITAADSSTPSKLSATVTLSLTVNPSLSITTTGLPGGAANKAYSAAFVAAGGTPPYTFSATGFPVGLSMSAAGKISGAPQSAGTSSVTITATDSSSPTKLTATATFSLVVGGPLSITTTSLPGGAVGSVYNAPVTAAGGASPYTFTATGLPAGLAMSSAGQITGTPQFAGTSSVVVTVTDSTGPVKLTATVTFSLVVNSGLAIMTTSLPGGAVGVSYTGSVAATGGVTPYAFSATGLPAGLSMAANGQITGTPQSAASSSVVVTVTDSTSPMKLAATATLSLVVNSGLAIRTTALPAGTVGSAYSQTVSAVGGALPYTFFATGLPVGLALSASGQITGMPQAAGISSVVITVKDSSSPAKNATATLGLNISALPITVTTTTLPPGLVGSSYAATLQVTGGTIPYQWVLVSGTLPAGLTFNNGTIGGVPTAAAANSALTFRVTDSGRTAQTATVNLSITINQGGLGGSGLIITGGSVGNGLQIPIAINLSPVPAGALNITISSNNPAAVALAEKPTDTGVGSLTLPLNAGVGSFSVYAQGRANAGSVILTISASGYANGTAQVTLAPSAFVLSGLNGNGGSFVTNQNTDTLLTISAARLDSSGNVAQIQQVSGAAPATVQLALADSTLGSLIPNSVSFQGGSSSQPVTFTSASSAGSTTITLNEPAGFTTPSGAANVLPVTVQPVGVIPGSVIVGQGLETTTNVTLQGAPTSDIFVTIVSSDPSKLLLAVNPTDAGSASIQMKVIAGVSRTPAFYVYGLANSGSVTYSATAPGFGTANGTVTLAKSGFLVGGPFGLTQDFTTSTLSQPSSIDVQTAVLDASGNYLGTQSLAGGSPVQVNVASQNTSVGAIAVSPVTMLPANNDVTTLFQPMGKGSTVISVSAPAPFVTPAQGASITATVSTPGILLTDGVTVGKNLSQQGVIILPATPSTDLTVTLTVASGQLALSANGTDSGSSTINVVIPAGTINGTYYMYGLDTTGTATVSAVAPGYVTSTGTLTLVPSGVIIYGTLGASGITASAGGAVTINVSTAKLDPAGIAVLPLAGGQTITASLSSSDTNVGTVPATASITGGADTATFAFTAKAAGSTVLSVGTPSGYTTPAQFISITAQVQ